MRNSYSISMGKLLLSYVNFTLCKIFRNPLVHIQGILWWPKVLQWKQHTFYRAVIELLKSLSIVATGTYVISLPKTKKMEQESITLGRRKIGDPLVLKFHSFLLSWPGRVRNTNDINNSLFLGSSNSFILLKQTFGQF